MKKAFTILLFVFIVSIAFVSEAKASQEEPVITLSSFQNTVRIGQEFEVEVAITNVANLAGYTVVLEYDPTMLALTNTQSPWQGGTVFTASDQLLVLENKLADNHPEQARYTCVVLAQAYSFTGDAVLATIKFKALATGDSSITLTPDTLLATWDANSIPAAHNDLDITIRPKSKTTAKRADSSTTRSGSTLTVTSASIDTAQLQQAATIAQQQGTPVQIAMSSSSPSLRLTHIQLAALSATGVEFASPQGTQIHLSSDNIQALTANATTISMTSTPLEETAVAAHLRSCDTVLSAEDISLNTAGTTVLRFPLSDATNVLNLAVKVLHSDGSEEYLLPTISEDGCYAEVAVDHFSTFILFEPGLPTLPVTMLLLEDTVIDLQLLFAPKLQTQVTALINNLISKHQLNLASIYWSTDGQNFYNLNSQKSILPTPALLLKARHLIQKDFVKSDL